MRKLVLFALLGGAFGGALLLEHFVSRATPERKVSAAQRTGEGDGVERVVLQLGGGVPRAIPESPPRDEVRRANGGTRRDDPPREKSAPIVRPPPSNVRTHVVAKGETLSTIARGELGSSTRWKDLASWNDIAEPSALKEGAVLRLAPPSGDSTPAPADESRTHKVAKGETLSRIAARYLGDATRWKEIQRLNQIADPANVAEGTTLRIPER